MKLDINELKCISCVDLLKELNYFIYSSPEIVVKNALELREPGQNALQFCFKTCAEKCAEKCAENVLNVVKTALECNEIKLMSLKKR